MRILVHSLLLNASFVANNFNQEIVEVATCPNIIKLKWANTGPVTMKTYFWVINSEINTRHLKTIYFIYMVHMIISLSVSKKLWFYLILGSEDIWSKLEKNGKIIRCRICGLNKHQDFFATLINHIRKDHLWIRKYLI